MDDALASLLQHVTADNVIGAACLLGLAELRRVLHRIDKRTQRISRRLEDLEDIHPEPVKAHHEHLSRA